MHCPITKSTRRRRRLVIITKFYSTLTIKTEFIWVANNVREEATWNMIRLGVVNREILSERGILNIVCFGSTNLHFRWKRIFYLLLRAGWEEESRHVTCLLMLFLNWVTEAALPASVWSQVSPLYSAPPSHTHLRHQNHSLLPPTSEKPFLHSSSSQTQTKIDSLSRRSKNNLSLQTKIIHEYPNNKQRIIIANNYN